MSELRCTCPPAWAEQHPDLHVQGCRAVSGCSCPETAWYTGLRDAHCPAHGHPFWRAPR